MKWGSALGRRAWRHARCSAVMAAALGACSSPPPAPPPPTVVSVELTATPGANPTQEGQGAPVLVRIYQLASPSSFEGAEFFRLYMSDAATLGGDLIKKDELLLVPGAKKSVTFNPPENVHAVGVFAGYRDFQNVVWRVTAEIPSHKTTTLAVTVDAPGLKLTASSKSAGP